MDDLTIPTEFNKQQEAAKCKGLVFRYSENTFLSVEKGIYQTQARFKVLKRKSCNGCEFCGYLLETLSEDLAAEHNPILPQNPSSNKLYGLRVINESTDFETGYVDSFDMEFYELDKTS